jgi:hypothetical protein
VDARIKAWQDYMKTAPLGVGYGGASDGVMNPALKTALQGLETKLRDVKKPTIILSGNGVAIDPPAVKSVVDTLVTDAAPSARSQNQGIIEWKKYLQGKGLYKGDLTTDQQDDAFKTGMQNLEAQITTKVPSVVGMIWQNGQINPQATIADVEEALGLLAQSKKDKTKEKPQETPTTKADLIAALEKIGVTNFDELGSPDAPDFIGAPFNQMFISQEDSKANETDPGKNQNQGAWQNPAPKKPEKAEKGPSGLFADIDDRMMRLVDLMDELKGSEKKIHDM